MHSFGNHDAEASSPKTSNKAGSSSFSHHNISSDRGDRREGSSVHKTSRVKEASRITKHLNKNKTISKQDENNKKVKNNWVYFDEDNDVDDNRNRTISHRKNRAEDTHSDDREGRDHSNKHEKGSVSRDDRGGRHKFEFMDDHVKGRSVKNSLKIAKFILGFRRYLFRRAAQEQKMLPASRRLMAHPSALCEKVNHTVHLSIITHLRHLSYSQIIRSILCMYYVS